MAADPVRHRDHTHQHYHHRRVLDHHRELLRPEGSRRKDWPEGSHLHSLGRWGLLLLGGNLGNRHMLAGLVRTEE